MKKFPLCVRIDSPMRDALRLAAISRGEPIGALVRDAIVHWLLVEFSEHVADEGAR